MPRQRRKKHSYDDAGRTIHSFDELAEVAAWVAEADHDDDMPELKQARESAREAERDQEWD